MSMTGGGALANLALLGLCYCYVLIIIFATGKIGRGLSPNSSRKFLHILIGNLVFIIPFFSDNAFPLNFPFFVAAPFVLVTYLVSPYSPVKDLGRKMPELAEVTKGGHEIGLVSYALSYTALACLFSSRPYIIAAGVIPMSYGDAAASLVGERFGRHCIPGCGKKSVEGSFAMFVISFAGLSASLLFFSALYTIPLATMIMAALVSAAVATVAEASTPQGFDNITVPFFSTLLFLLMGLL